MFRTGAAAADPPTPHAVDPAEQLVSLVELGLTLDAPAVGGWDVYLASHGVAVVADDIGRPAVARSAARMLIAEQGENEARKAEIRAAAEKRAVEQDQQFRASLGVGVPAGMIPAGMSYAEAIASAELDAQQYSPRASVAQDLLDRHTPGEIVFHSLAQPAEE